MGTCPGLSLSQESPQALLAQTPLRGLPRAASLRHTPTAAGRGSRLLSQGSTEGGFNGRTNKLVDGCYSFWQGGIFPLLAQLPVAALRLPRVGGCWPQAARWSAKPPCNDAVSLLRYGLFKHPPLLSPTGRWFYLLGVCHFCRTRRSKRS